MNPTIGGIRRHYVFACIAASRMHPARPHAASPRHSGRRLTLSVSGWFGLSGRRYPIAQPSGLDPSLVGGGPVIMVASSEFPSNRESRYPPAPAQPEQDPLKVRIELRLVDGPEGGSVRRTV